MNGELGDVEIQKWCNKQLEEANKSSRINSFKDKNLANAVIDLCDILSPGSADYRYSCKPYFGSEFVSSRTRKMSY